MRLKKLGAALVVVAALGAVLASSAFAAAATEDGSWYIGNPGTTITGRIPVKAVIVGAKATFFTTVSGQELVLSAKKIDCTECYIEDVAGTSGEAFGKLTFLEVSVEKPAHCTTSESITTNELKVTPDWMIGATDYVKFTPSAGEEKGFASFTLSGAECPLATTIVPKGSVFVQAQNATGTQAVSQEVRSSKTINETAGGSLHVGTEAAWLEGNAAFSLSGEDEGIAFGTH